MGTRSNPTVTPRDTSASQPWTARHPLWTLFLVWMGCLIVGAIGTATDTFLRYAWFGASLFGIFYGIAVLVTGVRWIFKRGSYDERQLEEARRTPHDLYR